MALYGKNWRSCCYSINGIMSAAAVEEINKRSYANSPKKFHLLCRIGASKTLLFETDQTIWALPS